MLSGVFAFSWSKWSASPALGRRQFVMRAAEWDDEGGAGTEREVRGAYDGGGRVIWTNGELDVNLCWNLQAVWETSSLSSSLSSLFCFLQPAWFLMVGGDRSFKVALKEEDDEFSDELREDCEVRGEGGRGGEGMEGEREEGGEGRGTPVSEVVSTHYINSVCWSGSAL